MRISAPGHPKAGIAQRGITLVELLIVITIMGMMAGLVVMTVPNKPALDQEAEKLARELITWRDQAVVESQTIGLAVLPSGLAVFEGRANEWAEVHTYQISDELTLEVKRDTEWDLPEHEDNVILSSRREPKDDEDQPTAPDIRFSPLGEVTPFAIHVLTATDGIIISVDEHGEMESIRYGER